MSSGHGRSATAAVGPRTNLPLLLLLLHPIPSLPLLASSPRSWFNGNQTAVWTSTNSSSSNAFCINVHGTANIVVGDVTLSANTPVDIEWFCDGFSSYLGGA